MKKLNFILFLSIIILIFFSCNDNNPEHIDERKEEYIFKLSQIEPNNTIYLYNSTKLIFTIESEMDIKISNISFALDNQNLRIYNNEYIILHPFHVREEGSILDVKIQTITKSGEISEKQIQYKISRLDNSALNVKQDRTNDNYLKLTWCSLQGYETLKPKGFKISFYDKLLNKEIEISLSDTVFIDKTYAYGERKYKLSVLFENDEGEDGFDNSWEVYYDVEFDKYNKSDFTFNNIGIEEIKIEWKQNLYNCQYIIDYGDGVQRNEQYTENSIEIARYSFPTNNYLRLYIVPKDCDVTNYRNIDPIIYNYHDPILMKEKPAYRWGYTYDTKKDIIYISNIEGLYSYNANTLELISSNKFNNKCAAHIACSATDSRIALNMWNRIFIYDTPSFGQSFSFTGINVSYDSYPIFDMAGNIVIASTSYSNVYVYNSTNGSLLYSIPLMNSETKAILSANGEYLCFYDPIYYGNMKLYKLMKDKFELVYDKKDMGYITRCEFNPLNADELIISHGDERHTLFNITTLSQSGHLTGPLGSVDPFTGNRLLYENGTWVIYNNQRTRKLVELKQSFWGFNGELYNNILFAIGSEGLHYINLKEYMK